MRQHFPLKHGPLGFGSGKHDQKVDPFTITDSRGLGPKTRKHADETAMVWRWIFLRKVSGKVILTRNIRDPYFMEPVGRIPQAAGNQGLEKAKPIGHFYAQLVRKVN